MISRDEYIAAIQSDINILKHLYTKVQADKRAWRPTPGQRSLQELLNNIPCNLATICKHMMSGDWSTAGETIKKVQADAEKDFIATLDREATAFFAIIYAVNPGDFDKKDVTLPNGQQMKLGPALLNMNLKLLTSYKMQLFLYLKQSGRSELNTLNLWFGIDGKMPGQK